MSVGLDFGDVVVGTNHHGAERPRVRVGHALVIHRHVEEPGGAERLAVRLDLFQVSSRQKITWNAGGPGGPSGV